MSAARPLPQSLPTPANDQRGSSDDFRATVHAAPVAHRPLVPELRPFVNALVSLILADLDRHPALPGDPPAQVR